MARARADAARPNLHQWDFAGHDGTVVVTYKVFGDRMDGTYLSIDDLHAHINIPAALMFARGWFDRPARVTFMQPPGRSGRSRRSCFLRRIRWSSPRRTSTI